VEVAEAVRSWTCENLGRAGFGDIGAVVGATYPEELRQLRHALGEVFFLVPGFGAQGAGAADTAGAFRPDGLGAIVSSSRGILFPFHPDDGSWEQSVEAAARATIATLAADTPAGRLAPPTVQPSP
jgi:orotidine-5'-phosphate decarboxylase